MSNSFKCTITTPEGIVFSEEVKRVTLGTEMGEITILTGHEPFVGLVRPGKVEIERVAGTESLTLGSGVVEVQKDGNLILLLKEVAQK